MSTPEEREETVVELHVPDGYREGARLDVYLAREMPNASRAKVQRGIKDGRVSVGGAVVTKPSHPVQAGDRIACRILRPPPVEVRPEPIPLDVVYEDDHLLVVNKPAGMVVHPAYGNRTGTLVNALLHHVGGSALRVEDEDEEPEDEDVGLSTVNALPSRAADPSVRPGIVHRLDKDTSGLLVVAKDDVTHRGLARQFEERTIRRRYLALVWGVPQPPSGTVEAALGRDPRDRKKMAVVAAARGKHAVTHYETVEPMRHTALVRFRLETGRTHQIRVHAEHIGHPVLGDPTYGGRSLRRGPGTARRKAFFANLFEVLARQALHAHTLGFVHPRTGAALRFEAPMPEDMAHVLARLRAVEGRAGAG
ncbi:MAG: RluA family pseudouridine synthase [Rhodothermales bacterium]|nr:RluA family pseudouridine synthase [Rhodothermales bacterium]